MYKKGNKHMKDKKKDYSPSSWRAHFELLKKDTGLSSWQIYVISVGLFIVSVAAMLWVVLP